MINWKTIPEYEDYEISDQGDVRNRNTGRIIKPSYTRGGYYKVNLRSDGVAKVRKFIDSLREHSFQILRIKRSLTISTEIKRITLLVIWNGVPLVKTTNTHLQHI